MSARSSGPKIQGSDYSYNFEDRLTKVQSYQGNAKGTKMINRGVTTMQYDGLGRRLLKSFDPKQGGGGAKSEQYVYDNLDPIAIYNLKNKQYSNYYRGDKNQIALMHNFPSGTQGQKYWYGYDALNSVVGITKQNGNSNHNYRYSDFGTVIPANGNFTQPHNRFTYTGIEVDNHSGLYEFYSRAYDSQTGVWLQQDHYRGQISDPMSLHRYMYVKDNPVNFWDAYGFQATSDEDLAISIQSMITMSTDEAYEVMNSDSITLETAGTSMDLDMLSEKKLLELESSYEKQIAETQKQLDGGYEAQMAGVAVIALGTSQLDSPVVPIMDIVAVGGFCVVGVITYVNQDAIKANLQYLLQEQTNRLKDVRDALNARQGGGSGTIDPLDPKNKSLLDKSYDYATDPNKMNHLFDSKHNLNPLVEHFGSKEGVIKEVLTKLGNMPPGQFETTVKIAGKEVVVRGMVEDGIIKIGTMFIP